MSELSQADFDRLTLRVIMALGRGRIQLGDDSGPTQQLQVKFSQVDVLDMQRLVEYGLASMPPEGTDAIAVFVGADRSNGVVIATGNQTFRIKGLKPGETAIHDNLGQKVYLSQEGMVVEGNDLPITVHSTASVTVNAPQVQVNADTSITLVSPTVTIQASTLVRMETPDLNCTGNITDNCDSTGRSMAADRVIFDAHDHEVLEVQGGTDTLTTTPPTPTE